MELKVIALSDFYAIHVSAILVVTIISLPTENFAIGHGTFE